MLRHQKQVPVSQATAKQIARYDPYFKPKGYCSRGAGWLNSCNSSKPVMPSAFNLRRTSLSRPGKQPASQVRAASFGHVSTLGEKYERNSSREWLESIITLARQSLIWSDVVARVHSFTGFNFNQLIKRRKIFLLCTLVNKLATLRAR